MKIHRILFYFMVGLFYLMILIMVIHGSFTILHETSGYSNVLYESPMNWGDFRLWMLFLALNVVIIGFYLAIKIEELEDANNI